MTFLGFFRIVVAGLPPWVGGRVLPMALSVVALIPARYGSTRLPGKPLALIRGKPLIQHVYERTLKARNVGQVLVATDDERIYSTVQGFGGRVRMTRTDHPTGTDRIAEVAQTLEADLVVNVQGDLVFFDPQMIEAAVNPLAQGAPAVMSTVKTPIWDEAEWRNPHVVKVVTDQKGQALYFSRSPIPFCRDRGPGGGDQKGILGYRHIGLYVYRRDFLLTFTRLPPTPLEEAEKLEQLRALEWGYAIQVVESHRPVVEVDTAEDLRQAQEKAHEE